ncbi:MAG: hypothetical protein H2045_04340 [Rhizobiales bacterium]|nr:hypothetical protein [Hyphomicrobiales bacterium]
MTIGVGHRRQRRRSDGADPFTDLLFNTLIGFLLLFFVAILFLNPEKKTADVKLDAQYIITVTWADNSPDDVDTWIEDPQGRITWYRDRNQGLVHLDRDDRGMLNDTITVEGEKIANPLNQEIVTLRGLVPGEYTVNLHYFESETKQPVEVQVRVSRVNPVYEVEYYGKTTLEARGVEKTALRFTILRSGTVMNINHLQKKLVRF